MLRGAIIYETYETDILAFSFSTSLILNEAMLPVKSIFTPPPPMPESKCKAELTLVSLF